ncbi:MAG: hypothetical protein WBA13_03705 [Microcoleaceae cyanobacterium]
MNYNRKLAKNFYRFSLLSLLTTTALIASTPPRNYQVLAQEHSGCFMVDHANRVISLNGMCPSDENSQALARATQEVNGIVLTNPVIQEGFVLGKITNVQDKVINISRIVLQFEDNKTGDVVTTTGFDVTAYLSPGQNREFRSQLSETFDLGGRKESEITPIFVGWE